MTCSTWRTRSRELKSHQDGYGPTMAQLSNMVEFKTLEEENRAESHDLVQESRKKKRQWGSQGAQIIQQPRVEPRCEARQRHRRAPAEVTSFPLTRAE